jgi:S-DNA-T family DNA segregation ATPase FtsK/SpoIIIE
LAQAHRIKPETPAIRVGIFRFVHGVLRELCFWSLTVVALGMIGALATFHPEDPAWTHTATAARLHNLGGVVGAWFADVTLYFFGHAAYLLPLGMVFAGWRLFKRGALLELDGEIVLFRVLGFLVTLATTCGLAAVHVRAVPGTLPGVGSSGGLVGTHVSQFLIQAFDGVGGNLFMLVLLLAGVVLTTGLSWLTLLGWVGLAVLRMVDWVGGVVMVPLRWMRPRPTEGGDDESTVEAAPVADSPEASPPPAKSPIRFFPDLGLGFGQAVGKLLTQWRSRGKVSVPAAPAVSSTPPAPSTPPSTPTERGEPPVAAPAGRHAARIEPVLNLPLEKPPSSKPPAAVLAASPAADWESSPALDMRTLVPGSLPAPAGGRPVIPRLVEPPRTPPVHGLGLAATASNDALAMVAPPSPSPMVAPVPWADSTPDLDLDGDDPEEHDPPSRGFPPGLTVVPRPEPAPAKVAFVARRVASPPPVASYPLPPLDLLDPPAASVAGYSPEALDDMSRRVEILLRNFGIAVQVVAVEPGPVITRFEIDPAPGVKVSQISNLAKDLARGLSVISVRVVEIIPGKSVIGLEIPNQQREIVYLREVLKTPVYQQAASPLTLALGKDIGGNPVVANLAKMPHLLVAGTTGSGKSVAINAMLLSLLYKAAPHEVRLILVDPKMLELSMYEDIPHLLTPVVTDMKEAANALRWCVVEMDRRYRLMAALKVRNIAGFNRKLADAWAAGESITDPLWKPEEGGVAGEIPLLEPLPFIVVVIDELADMMMIVGKKVEELIARLAQKARASGIHLILATQRPSVDVITGLIKANIPTRIAFQVSSRVDSRTILDQMGAEQLLGHGDMLYLPPGTGLPQRVHGAFVDDHEVPRVVDYLRQTGAPDYIDDVLVGPGDETDGGEEADGGERGGESDPLYDEAVRIVTESRRASVSGVQRRLRIGYNRAARLVEEMESAGVVGPVQTNGSREVLAPPPP